MPFSRSTGRGFYPCFLETRALQTTRQNTGISPRFARTVFDIDPEGGRGIKILKGLSYVWEPAGKRVLIETEPIGRV